MEHVFVGRQPIFDRDLQVYAYELLYRRGDTAAAGPLDGNRATGTVILNSLLEIGLDRLVGDRPAFINMTRDFLLRGEELPFPPERVTLEILEDVEVDAALVAAVRRLVDAGFRIALDDFVLAPGVMPLVELAHIVKIDLLAVERSRLPAQVAFLRRFGVRLVAEKVETQADFEACRQLGFEYFQGYFLCRPNVVDAQRLPENRTATLRLLAELQDPEVDFERLEGLIAQDVGLSYKLLRYVNSAAVGMRRNITAIREAILILGVATIRGLATLMTIVGVAHKPSELMKIAMTRARCCERLGGHLGLDRGMCFTVGLFSVLDALLDAPMSAVLEPLPLHEDVRRALLEGAGAAGALLTAVREYERGLQAPHAPEGLGQAQLAEAYLKALTWAEQSYREIAALGG